MAKPRGRNRKKGRRGAAPTQRKRRPQLPIEELDWKNYPNLRRFVSERGKIRARRITGLSRKQQSRIARAVKRAREMGLLIYPDQDRKVPKSAQRPLEPAPSPEASTSTATATSDAPPAETPAKETPAAEAAEEVTENLEAAVEAAEGADATAAAE